MVQRTEDWSSDWNSSKNPQKQRKYRQNAPLHIKDKLISANLSEDLRDELNARNIKVRTGDRARVMRGDEKGKEGIINRIDREEEKVYIDGIEHERTDGSKQQKALRPSNLQLVALNVENSDRIEKFDVEDIASIEVDEEELEEALEEDEEEEMMEQLQQGESGAHEEYEEEDEEDETEDEPEEVEEEIEETEEVEDEKDTEETAKADYGEIVSGTISDAKDQLEEMEDPDYEKVLEAEKDNKDRKTFKQWLESRMED